MLAQLFPDAFYDEVIEGENTYAIGVSIYEANHVTWSNLQTRACVQLGGTTKYSKVKESSERPFYNAYFTFNYTGKLEKMMDMILSIAVHEYRSGLRRHRVLASARLDLGAIWSQPGHEISDKWVLLTHPADPAGHIRGYINCEISIMPAGEKPRLRRFHEPSGFFIPESQGGGKLKARYIFRIHRGMHIYNPDIKGFSVYIRVFFAGLSGETTKRRNTRFPLWTEEIVFTELFPPMYNRFRIDVHFGLKEKCTKYLNLSAISDPAVKGFLPTYGPSFLHLYNPPYRFLGSLLVSLETKTVHAFSEGEKLLGVKRQKTQDLIEKMFWDYEEFALFGVVYEVSMLNNEVADKDVHIGLGFSTSEERPSNNRYISWGSKAIPMCNAYYCLQKNENKQTVYTIEKLPDNRHRIFVSNRLFHIAQTFGEDLTKIRFKLEYSPEKAKADLLASIENTIKNCSNLKSTASPGPTSLEKERFKTIVAKVNKIIKELNKIKPDGALPTMFEKCFELCKDLFNLVKDPQESFPQVILTLKTNERVVAYAQVHPSTVLYSKIENEKGIYCGVIQSLFLKGVDKKLDESFGGKIDILLWLGPLKSVGRGIESIPSGFQDVSQEYSFPSSIVYSEVHNFICRVHLYQGHFLPCDESTGACSLFVTVHFDSKCASSSMKKFLSPLWMESLVINNANIYGNIQDVKKIPPRLVIEIWNMGNGVNRLLGRHFVTPHVFLAGEKLQPPVYPPKPTWLKIVRDGDIKGEVLAMFEIVQDRGGFVEAEDTAEVITIPDYIKLPTHRYKFEVLFWGVRRSKSLPLSALSLPSVVVTCGQVEVTSYPLRNPTSFPNFSQPLYSFDLELPVDWHYAPPVVIRLFDNRAFGTQVFIGGHIVRNLKKFFIDIPPKPDWDDHRRSRVVTIADSLGLSESHPFTSRTFHSGQFGTPPVEKTPLVELKYDITCKSPLMNQVEKKRKRWWTYLCCCCRRKKEDPGYISLGLVSPFNDPDTAEEFYDWWTKYYDSFPLPQPEAKDEANAMDTGHLRLDIERALFGRKTPGIEIYSSELENQPEFQAFEDTIRTFPLTNQSSKKKNDTGKYKGCIALYTDPTEGDEDMGRYSTMEGVFSGVARELGAVISLTIRVYAVRAYQLHSKEKMGKVNSFMEISIPSSNQVISDSKHFIRQESNPIFGKCYELEARLPYDSELIVRVMDKKRLKEKTLIGETVIDIENRYYSRHRATCGLQKAFAKEGYNSWRDVHKPTEILTWLCLSHNMPLPIYESYYVIVGKLKFTTYRRDGEDMKEQLALNALLNWEKVPTYGCKLLTEHVETRSLYLPYKPGVERGKLEMWVDILPGLMELPPPVNVTPRSPEKFELRAVVWSTRNVKLVDDGALVGRKNTDIYVKGYAGYEGSKSWLKGKEDVQRTDVHYASLTGEGLFNWRFVFNFSYDRYEQMIVLDDFSNKVPPILYLQVWDQERIGANEYIGCLSIDIRDVPPPSKRFPFTKSYLPIKGWTRNLFRDRYARGWWPFIGEEHGKIQSVGMVDLELTLLTSVEAERGPAGRGRNDPDALPDPLRPVIKYTIWIVPFKAIKNYLWRYHKGALLKMLLIIIFGFFMVVMCYAFPNYGVKKLMHA